VHKQYLAFFNCNSPTSL